MKTTQSKLFNPNYCARIVIINGFQPHPNPKCERLKYAVVGGYQIAVSIDTKPGMFIYFPVECALSPEYIAANSLYRDNMKNDNPDQAGFFEDNGRVRMIRLQQYPSEGLLMPIESLIPWARKVGISDVEKTLEDAESNLPVNTDFDSIDGKMLCTKYVKPVNPSAIRNHTRTAKSKKERVSKLVENQFKLHYDTVLIKKCPDVIKSTDLISLTAKVHGTSGISAYVLCEPNLTWKDKLIMKILNWLPKVNCRPAKEYDYLYSSRSVVKNQYYDEEPSQGFYNCDVWKYADDVLRPHLIKGMTLYYEIVGYLPTGAAIQKMGGKAFDYGCKPLADGDEYEYEKHFGIQIYRITLTNCDGNIHEFSAREVQQWCKTHGLKAVEEYYYGYASDLYPDILKDENFSTKFIETLAKDTAFHMECQSPTCNNKVPHEGLVIKIEDGLSRAFKLKCAKFLEGETKELDTNDANIEDAN